MMDALNEINYITIIDIILVLILVFQLYKIVKGTVAINIFIGLSIIYLIWKTVEILKMELLTEILGQFISIGVLILVIVFQQELRRFLMIIGRGKFIKHHFFTSLFTENHRKWDINELILSFNEFTKNKTGVIIIIAKDQDLEEYIETGIILNAKITNSLLQSIFYKNSPLHDGAVIIHKNKIIAARCILPITKNEDFPSELGMRHRAGVGMSENSDAISIIISEQTGDIAYAKQGKLKNQCSVNELNKLLKKELENK